MNNTRLVLSVALFSGALLVSWTTHGTGVVHDDPARNISIPETLTVPLQVQAAYNGTDIFFRYRWPAERPGIFHDLLRYEGGRWVVEGRAVPGSQPQGLHEDRVAMMLDDGSVPEFGRYGGYVAIGAGLDGLSDDTPEEVTKYLPPTRNSMGPGAWDDLAPDDVQTSLRAAGYFIDLWHWRGNRSNPIGVADDQVIGAGRDGDGGRGAYATNFDSDAGQPRFMFDATVAGYQALRWDDVLAGRITQDQDFALTPENAVAYDPAVAWQEGDVLPRRYLRTPAESRADISVQGDGRWADGYWDVTLRRALDTGHPEDDKILHHLGLYNVAFAIHRNATGGRWHYVSLPFSLGLTQGADITATRFEGATPSWGDDWNDVTLFYPGQVTWPFLNSENHAGAESIARGVPVRARHTPEQLAYYGIETEFRTEIRRQWLYSLLAGVVLIFGFGFAVSRTISNRKGA